MFKLLLNLILVGVVGYLGFQLYKTIEEPIQFNTEKSIRDDATIEKLKLIRSAQVAYRMQNGKYTEGFDTLLNYIKTENYTLLIKTGDPNDSTQTVKIDTTTIPIIDSLFKGNTAKVDELPLVPFANGEKFEMSAGMIVKNETDIPAFEAKTKYGILYNGLIEKYFANKKDDYIRVGSMDDATTTGNWEQ